MRDGAQQRGLELVGALQRPALDCLRLERLALPVSLQQALQVLLRLRPCASASTARVRASSASELAITAATKKVTRAITSSPAAIVKAAGRLDVEEVEGERAGGTLVASSSQRPQKVETIGSTASK